MTTTQIALLRAVNVGGRGKVAMADLRGCLTGLGFVNARTVLQSGNLVFDSDGPEGAELEKLLENEFLRCLELPTSVFNRSAAQWGELIAANPLAQEARRDPAHLLAIFTKQRVASDAMGAMRLAVANAGGREVVADAGGQVYIYYPDGIGRSRVTTSLIEKSLGGPVTGRNWNTVLKLVSS
jgi:uncharacterized protein (DUF1697 family)